VRVFREGESSSSPSLESSSSSSSSSSYSSSTSSTTAPPSVSHAACNVSTAPLWQPTAILSPADAHDDTGRAEEGGQHLFLAVSTAIRTHAGVVDEFEVIFLGYDVTPNAATSYLRAPVAKSHKNVSMPSAEPIVREHCAGFRNKRHNPVIAPFSHALSVLYSSHPAGERRRRPIHMCSHMYGRLRLSPAVGGL